MIPGPAGPVSVVLVVLVLLVHVGHLGVRSGRHRLWHVVHVVMALGMIAMLWPPGPLVPSPVGVGVFGAATALLVAGLGAAAVRGVAVGVLWAVAGGDLALMAVMFDLMVVPSPVAAVVGAAWFGVQALGWAGGPLGRVLADRGLGDPVPTRHDRSVPVSLAVMSVVMAVMLLVAGLAPAPAGSMPGM